MAHPVRDESGNVILRRQVGNEWKKVRAFFDEVRERADPHGGYLSVVKICSFIDWLLKLLPLPGCLATIVVQPEERAVHQTERRDASALGEILWINRDRGCGRMLASEFARHKSPLTWAAIITPAGEPYLLNQVG